MKKLKEISVYVFIIFFLICLNVQTFGATAHAQGAPKKVLVVHSYHSEYEWVSTISRGIKRAFEGVDDIQVETVYMDTKRKTSEEWKRTAGERVRNNISEWDPDIIITVDDNAQEYVGAYYAGKKRPSVVFCGVNEEISKYGYTSDNVAGILERPHLSQAVELIAQLFPDAKKVAVISDHSPTSRGALKFIKDEIHNYDLAVVAYDMPDTFDKWKERILYYEQNADVILIYVYHTLKNGKTGVSVNPKEVMAWTVENTSLPTVGFFNFAIDDGVLLGAVESGIEHGKKAGEMVKNILNGRDVKDMPIITNEETLFFFNSKTAGRIGFSLVDKKVENMIDVFVKE